MTELAVASRAESRLVPGMAVTVALGAAAAGWIVLIARMSGMDAGPGGDPGALGWFAVSWAVMTAAMMLPASVPAVAGVARAWRARAPAAALLFLTAYVAVWIAAGLAAYAVVQAIRGLHWGVLAWSSAGRYVAGAAVLAAGLYQLTGVKRRWLARCRRPGDLGPERRTPVGALVAGLEHGGCCIACCWTLMGALYALGMMSIAWMVVVTALIVGERVLPRPARAVRAVAAVLIVLGIGVAAWPADVPGLTVPPAGQGTTMGMAGSMR